MKRIVISMRSRLYGDGITRELPDCKTAILCDAVSHPEQAREVMRAKQTGLINAFCYTSVSLEYFTAALDAI